MALAASDVAAITRMREEWTSAMNADHIAGMVDILAEDTIAFPPHEAPVAGRDAQRTWQAARVAAFTTRITVTPDELTGSGDCALDRFTYTLALTPRGGGSPIEARGNCFWIWQQGAGGAWKLARAIWNSDQPMPVVA